MGGSSSNKDTSNKTYGGQKPYNEYGYDHTGRAVGKEERNAWNNKRRSTGMGGERLRQHLNNQYNPMASFYEMMSGMGDMGDMGGGEGSHGPSGPSEEDLQTEGLNDLDKAYGAYIEAGETATNYVNTQIDSERDNAALLGIAFNITEEVKNERISDYFSTLYSAEDYTKLQDLNTEWGEFREGDPLEFLIQRGVEKDEAEEKTTGGVDKKPTSNSLSVKDPEDTLGTSTLSVGA